jgi:hypothetical protein
MLPTAVLFHIHQVVKIFHINRNVKANTKNTLLFLTECEKYSNGKNAIKMQKVNGIGGQAKYSNTADRKLKPKYLYIAYCQN